MQKFFLNNLKALSFMNNNDGDGIGIITPGRKERSMQYRYSTRRLKA